VSGPAGSVTLPVVVDDVLDGVIWLPLNSAGCHPYTDLGVAAGDVVELVPGGAE